MLNSRSTDKVDHIVPLAKGGLDDPYHDGETPERRSLNALKEIQTTAFHQVMLQCSLEIEDIIKVALFPVDDLL